MSHLLFLFFWYLFLLGMAKNLSVAASPQPLLNSSDVVSLPHRAGIIVLLSVYLVLFLLLLLLFFFFLLVVVTFEQINKYLMVF